MKMTIDELLETEYWIIDIFPKQVPADSSGQFFAVERYFLQKEQIAAIKQRHISLILKLNCFRSLSIDEEPELNPPPERIAEEMRKRSVCLLTEESLILSEPDDFSMTLYHPDDELLDLITDLAAGEGLYVWQPPQD